MEEHELTEVKRRIQEAEVDLERAQERGNEALELEFRRGRGNNHGEISHVMYLRLQY
jgi:hypothetical protein